MRAAMKSLSECCERVVEMKPDTPANTEASTQMLPATLQNPYAVASNPVVFSSAPPMALSLTHAPVPNAWPADRTAFGWPLGVPASVAPCVTGTFVPSVPVPSVPPIAMSHPVLPAIAATFVTFPFVIVSIPSVIPNSIPQYSIPASQSIPVLATTSSVPSTLNQPPADASLDSSIGGKISSTPTGGPPGDPDEDSEKRKRDKEIDAKRKGVFLIDSAVLKAAKG